MATYYDNPSGQRATATPRYFDDAHGQRYTLSGKFRLDDATGTGGGGGTGTGGGDATHLLGMYPGRAGSDDGVYNALGQYAQIASSYWQPSNYKSLSTVEATRMSRGIHSANLLAAVKDTTLTTAKATVVDTMNGSPPTILTDYISRCEEVAKAYPDVTMTIFPMGEMDVAFNKNKAGTDTSMKSLFDFYSGDGVKILTAMGKYTNEFFKLCDELAPHCLRAHFLGGSPGTGTAGNLGANNANRNLMFDQLTVWPDFASSDSYQNSYNTSATPKTTWKSDMDMYQTTTGVHYAHWVKWGKPPFIMNETGISHTRELADNTLQTVYSDDEMATWISKMYDHIVELDLRHVIYFNSESGPNGKQAIIKSAIDTYPMSVAAFSAELTEAKAAAAAAPSALDGVGIEPLGTSPLG